MKTFENESLTLQEIAGIAALAIVGSAVAGVSVLIAVRARGKRQTSNVMPLADSRDEQPVVAVSTATTIPHHFSEDLVVPGFTRTGQETGRQDAAVKDNPEGV